MRGTIPRHLIQNPTQRSTQLLLIVITLIGAAGCSTFARDASAFVGGAQAPWRGKSVIGAQPAASLTDTEIERRVAYLTEHLDESRLHAEAWQFGWLAINAGGAAVSTVQATSDHGNEQVFDIIEAVKGGIGTTYQFVRPIPAWRGATLVHRMPNNTHEEKVAQLRYAEELMREAAEHARRRKSWVIHLGNLGLNLAGAAVLFALDSPKLAGISLGLDTVVGEIQIWTRPWAPETAWDNYRQMVETGQFAGAPRPVHWSFVPTGQGAAFVAHF